jgi:hypothetical protein
MKINYLFLDGVRTQALNSDEDKLSVPGWSEDSGLEQ